MHADPPTSGPAEDRAARLAALRPAVPAWIDPAPLAVRDAPQSRDDAHFWQYPAITERLAWERHRRVPAAAVPCDPLAPVQSYLGLPWASYIDKDRVPEDARRLFPARLRDLRQRVAAVDLRWGEDVRIHTVCQHVHWQRLLGLWEEWGITDLHLSHCEPKALALGAAHGLRVHSWPLEAPNVVNPGRRRGLAFGKPLQARAHLASFIGAQMKHYRSDVRRQLHDEVVRAGGADVVFELRDEWHFNPVVYREQVRGRRLDWLARWKERAAMRRYNAVLSDSVFALCPEGAGPNTLRLWEALAVGAIPVVIVEDWTWPEVPAGAPAWPEAVIVRRRDEVPGLIGQLRQWRAAESARLQSMQQAGMALYARFVELRCF